MENNPDSSINSSRGIGFKNSVQTYKSNHIPITSLKVFVKSNYVPGEQEPFSMWAKSCRGLARNSTWTRPSQFPAPLSASINSAALSNVSGLLRSSCQIIKLIAVKEKFQMDWMLNEPDEMVRILSIEQLAILRRGEVPYKPWPLHPELLPTGHYSLWPFAVTKCRSCQTAIRLFVCFSYCEVSGNSPGGWRQCQCPQMTRSRPSFNALSKVRTDG